MTREEAVARIKDHIEIHRYHERSAVKIFEAFDMAIKALEQPEIVRCKDCKHYYFADNRIPQEHRYTCELDGDRWKPDDYCSYAERREDG